jgi:1-acyl-sn-glycerol-3-phosphate acyltransferase
MSLSGVVQYHGISPRREANQVHVANHTSMIDVVFLQQHLPYASVGQLHKGLVGMPSIYHVSAGLIDGFK